MVWIALAATGLGGCELQEITLAESEDVIVAEVLVQVGEGSNRVRAFLHRTEDGSRPGGGEVAGARIRIGIEGRGLEVPLLESQLDECLAPLEDGDAIVGTCYVGSPVEELLVSTGDALRLVIDLPDGRQILGETVVPGDFSIVAPTAASCVLDVGRNVEIEWTASDGTWAYISETLISGLRAALPADVEVDDPLDLVGLSISAADTTILFPSEFGIFERFDLERDVALLLQEGLPQGVSAGVIVGAADRNWVNWVRGGNFNPSGQVRIPSVRGAGTGVFASLVRRSLRIQTEGTAGEPSCTS